MNVPPSPYFDLHHPSLQTIDDPSARLWRYLDFTKYVALLATRSLWFSKSSLLGDPWEGAYTRANLERRLAEIDQVGREPSFIGHMVAIERSIYVNCWHMNPDESAAMWRLYASTGAGTAIETTLERLIGSLRIDRGVTVLKGEWR